ncbi:hypothetical protein CDAR_456541 [Caerostris darwini]|uniref:Uncharacterized protein n=1 Tax=Caerostris darwini TaxID=1538125 RepID=A0AAV4V8Y2_9ARAC|nr:hypothetical protein CDAR_456541 [Caerostris darwini]
MPRERKTRREKKKTRYGLEQMVCQKDDWNIVTAISTFIAVFHSTLKLLPFKAVFDASKKKNVQRKGEKYGMIWSRWSVKRCK